MPQTWVPPYDISDRKCEQSLLTHGPHLFPSQTAHTMDALLCIHAAHVVSHQRLKCQTGLPNYVMGDAGARGSFRS